MNIQSTRFASNDEPPHKFLEREGIAVHFNAVVACLSWPRA